MRRATLVLAALGCARGALAQCAPVPILDTIRPRVLEPILVVTAERSPSSLGASVAAVTRLSAGELARLPRATLADVLRLAPGFTSVDLDGLGFDPAIVVRGFYGGGEAEYVIVQVDGRPVNQLQTGLAAWDVLPPLASIDAVEVLRGGASSLYGDAAIGGVINVITRAGSGTDRAPRLRWGVSGGSFGTWRADADLLAPASWKQLGVSGGLDRTGGFRDHAERTAARALVRVPLIDRSAAKLAFTLAPHWREFQEPGPLLDSLLEENRRASDPLFRFDHTSDRSLGFGLEGTRRLGERTQLGATLHGELRRVDAIRTLALAPGFGDTKERLAASDRFAAGLQVESEETPLPGRDRLVIGLEGNRGSLDSKYYRYAAGTRSQYVTWAGERGELDTRGESVRTAGAVYALYTVHASAALRFSLGGRYDRLHDRFDPGGPAAEARQTATHAALSPKAGINLQYLNGATSTGNVYFTVSRAFKAPTLDQLYDQRNIPIPFPPFEIRTSNPELRPQHGTSVEAGLYQYTELAAAVRATASVSAYQMDMKDELDFDVNTFRYVNIGRSRHRGLEAGARLDGTRTSGFANYTLQIATSRSGDNAGKRLKAIPRHSLSAGLSVQPMGRRDLLQVSGFITHVRGSYLDDANTVTLPNYTRLDAQATWHVRGIGLFLDVRNLFGTRYSGSGFLDPSGSGQAYLFPAAGRVLEIGARGGW